MKRMSVFFVMCILLITLFGCSKAPSEPSNAIISEDLQKEFKEYCEYSSSYPLDYVSCEIIKSLTDEKTYSAEIQVTAKSKYANIYYTTNVEYILYDQGWAMDSCQWKMKDYEVIEYPEQWEIQFFPQSHHIENLEVTEVKGYENCVAVSGINKIDWSPYVTGEENITVVWEYDIDDDDWRYSHKEQSNTSYSLTPEFASAWTQRTSVTGNVAISNVSTTGFDISDSTDLHKLDTYHVELVETEFETNKNILWLTFSNPEVQFYLKDYECTQNGKLKVTIRILREADTGTNIVTGNNFTFDMSIDCAIINKGPYGYNAYPSYNWHLVD